VLKVSQQIVTHPTKPTAGVLQPTQSDTISHLHYLLHRSCRLHIARYRQSVSNQSIILPQPLLGSSSPQHCQVLNRQRTISQLPSHTHAARSVVRFVTNSPLSQIQLVRYRQSVNNQSIILPNSLQGFCSPLIQIQLVNHLHHLQSSSQTYFRGPVSCALPDIYSQSTISQSSSQTYFRGPAAWTVRYNQSIMLNTY
jgi:hypothetical protein